MRSVLLQVTDRDRTVTDHHLKYRPPLRVSSADRPPRNTAFCKSFLPLVVAAVDAVGTSSGILSKRAQKYAI